MQRCDRLSRATSEVDRTRKDYNDAKPADKARAWDLYQKAVNRLNAAIADAAKRPVRAPLFDIEDA